MDIKEVNRNIPENRENNNARFRVRYNDKREFDLLVVNICRLRTNEIQTFEFRSDDLPDKDSIHFSTSIDNGEFHVHWPALSKTPGTIKTQIKKDIDRVNFGGEKRTNDIESFPPIVGENTRILILGTMPGKDSLRLNEYYANPRNIFWRLVYKLEDSEIQNDYQSKIDFLKQNGISIWDVCYKATRESSLDADIKNEVPNNIQDFLHANPSIEIIAFNGKKAKKLYDKYFEKSENIKYLTLLSTSPANATFTFQEKLKDWGRLMNPDG